MDISVVKPVNREVHIKHPASQERIGLTIVLLPSSDDKIKAAKRRTLNARLHMRRNKITAEQLEVAELDLMVAACKTWAWVDDENGKPGSVAGEQPDFNDINVRKLLKEFDWIKDQLNEEIGDDAAFFLS